MTAESPASRIPVVGTLPAPAALGPRPGAFVPATRPPTEAAILRALSDAVITTDGHGRVSYLNPAAERLSGWLPSDLVGVPLSRVLRRDARRSRRLDDGHDDGQPHPYVLIDRRGRPRPVEACESVLTDERGGSSGRVFVCRDVGAALALSQAMSHRALHDPLTGLANRRGLLDRLHEAIASATHAGTSVAVCFLDVDGMKAVNDLHGHDAGDALLQSIANRLSTSVRATDTVARIGGDEFVVVLHRMTHADDTAAVTTSLTRRLARPHTVGGRLLRVDASLGWAHFPRDGHQPPELLRAADLAMYAVKRARAATATT